VRYPSRVKLLPPLVALGTALASVLSGRMTAVVELLPVPSQIAPEPAEGAPAPPGPPVAWAVALPALRFFNTRTGATCAVRLYAEDGTLDEAAAATVDRTAADRDAEPRPLDRRVLRLIVKAAAQLQVTDVDLVSTFRDSAREGSRHRSGQAIDFRLRGVSPARLAAHLRGNARVGVGVYLHRRTQFVHLDVREPSFHWADASPPGRVWRETSLTDRGARARDAAYQPEQDLPTSAPEPLRDGPGSPPHARGHALRTLRPSLGRR
jgi:uncharacterized protein YcbK (DUF882 family)